MFLWNLVDLERLKWEGPDALSPGQHLVEFDFKYDGLGMETMAFGSASGIGRGGTGTLKVDGKVVAEQKRWSSSLPLILQWDENLDVGSDTRTRGQRSRLPAAIRVDGKLNKLTLKINRPKLYARGREEAAGSERNRPRPTEERAPATALPDPGRCAAAPDLPGCETVSAGDGPCRSRRAPPARAE